MSFEDLLRVPLIFILDEVLKSSFGLPDLADKMFPVNSTLNQIEISESTQCYKDFIKVMVSCLIFCLSLLLLTLPAKYLLPIYLHVVSFYVVLVSYWENLQTIGLLSEKYKSFEIGITNEIMSWVVNGYIINYIQLYPRLYKLFYNMIQQYCISLLLDILQFFGTNHSIHKIFRYSFIIPTLITSLSHTSKILDTVTMLSTLLQLFVLIKLLLENVYIIANLIRFVYNYTHEAINNFGILIMFELEWYRLKIPTILQMFWAIRVLKQVLYLSDNIEIKNVTFFDIVKYLLINGCDTCTAVFGMTSFVSFFSDNLGAFFQWVLLVDEMNDFQCGELSAALFIILTMQSGLTSLDPENRLIKLYENIHLVFVIQQDYVYRMVDKLLINLNEYHNRSLNRHSRALLVCGFLLVYAVTILYLLLSYHSVSPWLLAVCALNIISIIQVLVSLAIYSLLLINSKCSLLWENIDDYVYNINLFGSMLVFCLHIFLFLNDVYNVVFVSGGVVRATVICIQSYFKVCLVKEGWRLFIKRRTVMKKIESLLDANSVQLSEFDDVCSICYQTMRSAKITKCNHYFHGECLRKWIYLQDNCPMCHTNLNNAEM